MSKAEQVIQEVLNEVFQERVRQDAKWGEQNHPNGTSIAIFKNMADEFRKECDKAHREGTLTWRHIMLEEFYEALAEEDPSALRKELVQTIAVGTGWIEAIDRAKLRGKGAV